MPGAIELTSPAFKGTPVWLGSPPLAAVELCGIGVPRPRCVMRRFSVLGLTDIPVEE